MASRSAGKPAPSPRPERPASPPQSVAGHGVAGHSATGIAASRRALLRAGLAAAALPAASVLVGCGDSPPAAASANSGSAGGVDQYVTGSTPTKPTLWPIEADNQPIQAGRAPERDATLRVFSWSDYIDPNAIRSFQDTYGVAVSVNSFSNATDALAAVADPANAYDVYFPNARQIDVLMNRRLLRPLTHSYLPNMASVWPLFQNPFYDQQWRYTVPYTVYSTGIAWRSDVAREDIGARPDPFDVYWDPKFRDRVSLVDDYREVLALPLLRANLDINSGRPDDLRLISRDLADLGRQTRPSRSVTDFSDVATGRYTIVQAWSGDVINALGALPAAVDRSVLRYWSPSDGRARAENDTMVLPRGGRAPVAAHLFVNHLLDPAVATRNFAVIGYQPPQNSISNQTMINSGAVPATLAGVIVEPAQFAASQRLLALNAATDARWRALWKDFWSGR